MTENEAIELLRSMQNPKQDYADVVCAPAFCTGFRFVYPEPEDYAIEEAIKALKEIQQYREIGTVEECKEMAVIANKKTNPDELAKIIVEWIQYNKIGTVEECREAVEKQKPKKPVLRNDNGKLRKSCPVCGCFFSPLSRSCPKCGQAIQWNENLEGME